MSHIMNVENVIQDMGYVMARPKSIPIPSYYKLEDGNILSVLVRINYVLMNASESSDGSVNYSTDIHVFSPNKHKSYKSTSSNRPPAITNQDVKYTSIKEGSNDYVVGEDIIVSVKAVVAQIAKTDAYSNEGEPIYNINVQPMFKLIDKRRM